jgi:hypothetical protein
MNTVMVARVSSHVRYKASFPTLFGDVCALVPLSRYTCPKWNYAMSKDKRMENHTVWRLLFSDASFRQLLSSE